jgi:hypothetical protein
MLVRGFSSERVAPGFAKLSRDESGGIRVERIRPGPPTFPPNGGLNVAALCERRCERDEILPRSRRGRKGARSRDDGILDFE